MSATVPSASVVIIGRSASERNVVAGACQRAGMRTIDVPNASALKLASLQRLQLVIALDQHDYVQQWLQQAGEQEPRPVFLPIVGPTASPSKATTPQQAPAAEEVPPSPAQDDASFQHALSIWQWQELEHLLAEHRVRKGDRETPQDDTLIDAIERILFVSSDGHNHEALTLSHPTIDVRDMEDVRPELVDARDPGPLTELESPPSTNWFVALAIIVSLATGAYLMFAPQSQKEKEAVLQQQKERAAELAWKRAAHVTFQARKISQTSTLEQRTLPIRCQRLLTEGKTEIAQEVCAKATRYDLIATPFYATTLLRQGQEDQASELLDAYLQEHPQDVDALRAKAFATRSAGDTEQEIASLHALIQEMERVDPLPAWRERLKELLEQQKQDQDHDPEYDRVLKTDDRRVTP